MEFEIDNEDKYKGGLELSIAMKLHTIKEMKDLGNTVTEFLKQLTENVVISVSYYL